MREKERGREGERQETVTVGASVLERESESRSTRA